MWSNVVFFFFYVEPSIITENVKSIQSVRAYGQGLQQGQVDIETSFIIDARTDIDRSNDIKVLVTSKTPSLSSLKLHHGSFLAPSKHPCPMQVVNNRDGTWTVTYCPNEVGETYFDIFLADELVPGCPFKVNIFDVQKIYVSPLSNGLVGQLVKFEIDASQAGVGQLEIIIQDGRIPCSAQSRGSFYFDASFLPYESGRYTVDVRFNGLPVPGNLFR